MSVSRFHNRTVIDLIDQGEPLALATLVETVGSSPLDPGAMMLVDRESRVEGSVAGGCVEGALVAEAGEVLDGGSPRVCTYGVSDGIAADVGLTCGGTIHVFVEEITGSRAELVADALRAADENREVAIATVLDGPESGGRLALVGGEFRGEIGEETLLGTALRRDLPGFLEEGRTVLRRYGADGAEMGADVRVYVQVFTEAPKMVICGAIDFSAALAGFADGLGYRTSIVDPREPFLRSKRFSTVADTVVEWPDRYLNRQELGPRDVVLVFSHDPKFDVPAIVAALATGVGYIGALGSRRTQSDRFERLREAGVREADLERINAPCGLDIGARTPEQTAISILAEIVALSNEREGRPLHQTTGSIHGTHAVESPPVKEG